MTGVGARVYELRKRRGLSQAALAGSEVSPSYVSLIESGRRAPTNDVLELLASRLDTSAHYLRTGQEGETITNIRLELSFAQLAMANEEPAQALVRLGGLDLSQVDRSLAAEVVLARAEAHERLGELESSISLLEPLLADCLHDQAWASAASAGTALAAAYLESGDLLRAGEVGSAVLARLAEAGLEGSEDYLRLGATTVWVAVERGDLVFAQHRVRELLVLAERHGSRTGQGALYWNASLAAQTRGRISEAVTLAQRALALLAEEQGSRDLPRLRMHHAALLLLGPEPDPQRALQELAEAAQALRGSRIEQAVICTSRGRAELLLGELEAAAASAQEALDGFGDQPRLEATTAMVLLGDIAFARSDAAAARDAYRRAADVLSMMQASRAAARVWRELGDRFGAHGEAGEAARAYANALDELGVRASQTPDVDISWAADLHAVAD